MSPDELAKLISQNFGTFLTVMATVVGGLVTGIFAFLNAKNSAKKDIQSVINDGFEKLITKLQARITEQDKEIAQYRTEAYACMSRVAALQQRAEQCENEIDTLHKKIAELKTIIRNRGERSSLGKSLKP